MTAKKTLADVQQVARDRGGLCLSDTYQGRNIKLEWQCAHGHRWQATPAAVCQGGCWCPICFRASKRDTLDNMHQVAARHGGRCLSEKYTDSATPLLWECAQGHRWEAVPGAVKHRTWCPECARLKRITHTLDTMQAKARERGGECLSEKYINNATPLKWRCHQGHEWEAAPNRILQGAWCQQCYYDSMRGNLQAMQALAQSRGGLCLSTHYVNAHSPLRWQCAKGHIWDAVPHSIQKGWCARCAARGRYGYSIEDMRKLARARGGKCLSSDYLGVLKKLTWECHRGHVWDTKPTYLLMGHWCPQCAILARIHKKNSTARQKYETSSKHRIYDRERLPAKPRQQSVKDGA